MIGIIGGSGFYEVFDELADGDEKHIATPYGEVPYISGQLDSYEVCFISRHGRTARYPPHRVNYHGHIWALHALGAERILATSAVGSVNMDYRPGEFVLPDQYLDLTKRVTSFFNGGDDGIFHADMTDPFCYTLFMLLSSLVEGKNDFLAHTGGCYACLTGPAFETRAEITMVQRLGADIVGMTVVPEAKLAREIGLCYYPVGMVVNWGAGLSEALIAHEHTVKMVNQMQSQLIALLREALERLPDIATVHPCNCHAMGTQPPEVREQ